MKIFEKVTFERKCNFFFETKIVNMIAETSNGEVLYLQKWKGME